MPELQSGEISAVGIRHGCPEVIACDSLSVVALEIQVHALPAQEQYMIS